MNQRHVRMAGRQTYGRAQPLGRVQRRGAKRPKLTPRQGRVLAAAAGLLLIWWGIAQAFAVNTIKVAAPSRGAEIEQEARRVISHNWKWGNMLTFDGGAFAAKLQDDDATLKSVSVKRQWPHTVAVNVTFKQPSLAWSTGNQVYVLDRDGTVIGSAAGSPALPVVYDGSNVPVQVGQQAVSAHFVEFTSQVVPALSAMGITVTHLDIKDTTLDLAAQTNKGYRLLFDTGREVDEELNDLKAVQRLLVAQKKTPAEYIDLRIAGKAYYK